jgi:hypothetical protein
VEIFDNIEFDGSTAMFDGSTAMLHGSTAVLDGSLLEYGFIQPFGIF